MASSKPKIVIVGGGMAGCAAANMLINNGITNVTILEAKNTLGGRISWTQCGADGKTIEMGAQWIHGEDGNPVFELAKENDLIHNDEEEIDYEELFYTPKGVFVDPELVKETRMLLDNIFEEGDKFSRENVPLENQEFQTIGSFVHEAFYKYLRTSGDSDDVKKIKEAIFYWRMLLEKTENACKSVYEMSLYAWGEYLECPGNYLVTLKHGYKSVLDLVTKNIPVDNILLNTPVKAIHWDQSNNCVHGDAPKGGATNDDQKSEPLSIDTFTGKTITADHVIFTGSTGVLKKNATQIFKPLLPYEKIAAIHRIGFGTVNKIYLEFEGPFWDKNCEGMQFLWVPNEPVYLSCLENKDTEEKNSDWFKAIHGFDTVDFQPNLLCGWIAGEEAGHMELLSDDTIINVCHELLQRFTGKSTVPRPKRLIRSRWHNEPYIHGSYSYIRVGSTATDCDILANPLPSEKDPRLMFAGEGTHRTYFSTVHGAMLSGQREAQRILSLYP